MAPSIVEKLASIVRDLPNLPSVAQEVLRLLNVPGTHPASIQNVMSRDPALSLQVIRMANSAYYRRGREITSLADAIVLLGFKTIHSLVLSGAVRGVLAGAGDVSAKLWEHCWAVGLACREAANINRLSVSEKEEAFLAGLFHDVAKGVMASRFPGIYASPLGVEGERELLGFDHALLGRVLLNKWQIPAALADSVGGHHSPDGGKLALLIALGDHVAQNAAPGVAPKNHPLPEQALSLWSLSADDVDQIRDAVEASISEERERSDDR